MTKTHILVAYVAANEHHNAQIIYQQEVPTDGLMDSQFLLSVGARAADTNIEFDEIRIARLDFMDHSVIPFKTI